MGSALVALIALSPISQANEATAPGQRISIGVEVQKLGTALRERMSCRCGVFVSDVEPGSLAEKAGIEPGDVLVMLGSVTIRTPDDVELAESRLEPGQSTAIAYARDGGRTLKMKNIEPPAATNPDIEAGLPDELNADVPATDSDAPAPDAGLAPEAPPADPGDVSTPPKSDTEVSEAPQPTAAENLVEDTEKTSAEPAPVPMASPFQDRVTPGAAAPTVDLRMELVRMGVRADDLTPDLAAALGAPKQGGVVVLHVQDGSPAALAGVRGGDVISRVGDQKIWGVEHLASTLESAPSPVSVALRRKGVERKVNMILGAKPLPAPALPEEPTRLSEDPARDPSLVELRQELLRLRREVRKIRGELNDARDDRVDR